MQNTQDEAVLGDLVVSVLAIGLKVRRFKPCREQSVLRAIRIRSTTFFGRDEKPSVPCRKTLRHDPYEYKRDTSYAKFIIPFGMFLLLSSYMTVLVELIESSSGRITSFTCKYHSAAALHAHVSRDEK
jgi:hypothetical protein